MTVRLDWFGFSEGAAADARGSLSLIGFAPTVQEVLELPSQPAPLNMIIVLVDDAIYDDATLVPGTIISFHVQIFAPSGTILAGLEQSAPLGARKYEDIPGGMIVVLGAFLSYQEFGEYRADLSVTIRGPKGSQELTGTRSLHVRSASAVAPAGSKS